MHLRTAGLCIHHLGSETIVSSTPFVLSKDTGPAGARTVPCRKRDADNPAHGTFRSGHADPQPGGTQRLSGVVYVMSSLSQRAAR